MAKSLVACVVCACGWLDTGMRSDDAWVPDVDSDNSWISIGSVEPVSSQLPAGHCRRLWLAFCRKLGSAGIITTAWTAGPAGAPRARQLQRL